ncbi:hypothetical protein HYC85_021772 [Camellia sinensis]|uniref:Protein BIC1 n=1 Tax=Camellia sinensis TaxID=4442 RepID=A0A7J7GK42_CAMSI|nr:hypothetical protein HYC85_021772 [Camellia sinensis]
MNKQPTTVSPSPMEAKQSHSSHDDEKMVLSSKVITSESETHNDQTESQNPSSKPHWSGADGKEAALRRPLAAVTTTPAASDNEEMVEVNGRERLKRHRVEVAGRIWIPDIWGQEDLLKDWIDCTGFDASKLKSNNIMSARAALVKEGRIRGNSRGLRIENRC